MLTEDGIISPGLGDTVGCNYSIRSETEQYAGRSAVLYAVAKYLLDNIT